MIWLESSEGKIKRILGNWLGETNVTVAWGLK